MKKLLQEEHKRPTKEYAGLISSRIIQYYVGETAAAMSFPHLRVVILEGDIRKSRTPKQFWIDFIIAILNEIPEGKDLSEEQKRKFVQAKIEFPYGY